MSTETSAENAEPSTVTSDDVVWLTLDQQQSWRTFIEGTMRLNEALNRDLEQKQGVSMNEYEILVRLSESDNNTMRMSELADNLAHSRSRITHTVRRMSDRGLVERQTCEGDGRGVNCVLTERGYQALVASAPDHVRAVRKLFVDHLTPEEFDTLGKAMEKVTMACLDNRDGQQTCNEE